MSSKNKTNYIIYVICILIVIISINIILVNYDGFNKDITTIKYSTKDIRSSVSSIIENDILTDLDLARSQFNAIQSKYNVDLIYKNSKDNMFITDKKTNIKHEYDANTSDIIINNDKTLKLISKEGKTIVEKGIISINYTNVKELLHIIVPENSSRYDIYYEVIEETSSEVLYKSNKKPTINYSKELQRVRIPDIKSGIDGTNIRLSIIAYVAEDSLPKDIIEVKELTKNTINDMQRRYIITAYCYVISITITLILTIIGVSLMNTSKKE